MQRLTLPLILLLTLTPLILTYPPIAVAAPTTSIIYVSASANNEPADGTASRPFQTIADALKQAEPGDTVEVDSGTYREGELVLNGVTLKAKNGTKPVLTGTEALARADFTGQNGIWTSKRTDFVRFNQDASTNPKKVDGDMSRFPEAVFFVGTDGTVEELTQVDHPGEVKPGTMTFYVRDLAAEENPAIASRLANSDSDSSWVQGPHTGAQYVLGSDPGDNTVEIIQHGRALTMTGNGAAVMGLTISNYAPIQSWSYVEPVWGTNANATMVFNASSNSYIDDVTFSGSQAGPALHISDATDVTVTNSSFTGNGSNGAGANRAHRLFMSGNTFSDNGAKNFITAGCGAYCTAADLKITHTNAARIESNAFDRSQTRLENSDDPFDASDLTMNHERQTAFSALWLDEGVINSTIVANSFANIDQAAIFDEIGQDNVIASNLIQGSKTGIQLSGSARDKVWNNTIVGTIDPIYVREDGRVDACNLSAEWETCPATYTEKWSAGQYNGGDTSKPMPWDSLDNELINNVIASKPRTAFTSPSANKNHRYMNMILVEASRNLRRSGEAEGRFAGVNEQLSESDYNVFVRPETIDPATGSDLYLTNFGIGPDSWAVSETLKQESQAQGLTIAGKDTHSLDLRADRGDSPIFVRETSTITDYSGDYRIRDGSPADGSGKPLSAVVASALGLPTGTTVDRGALVNVAWNTSSTDLGSNTHLSDGIWGEHFETVISGGWGTSWSVDPAVRFTSGTGKYGIIAMDVAGTGSSATVRNYSSTTTRVNAYFTFAENGAGGRTYVSIAARGMAGVADSYYVKTALDNGKLSASLMKRIGSEETTLATIPVEGTFSPGMRVNVIVEAVGTSPTTLQAKVWLGETSAPTEWDATATDDDPRLQRRGVVRINTYLSGSATSTGQALKVAVLSVEDETRVQP
ncbi:right-handed parallel beta-helix repeat-containing protein [Actinomyces glycerinitolerans]|uniref:Pectin lyase fold/virulence factor n=1 Tax=Actinomyces glycerinitolerans TaxID=1892869 RepID=A0A1M4RXH9_9ACTO|nr:right-handed parallel beta-helix repeat-containing protein [Actinomyces glycerinitolerans]SHE24666.1 pectin lyase fold/virulence factor [Actinomyces glycerinitolerans]